MKAADYIAHSLSHKGVTDVFGVPGGVILELIYAFDRTQSISPHLCYHEQSAGFAACGYAQSGGTMGVAYATRGPGFTNLLTPIADAWYDSIPVLFLTAHASIVMSSCGRTLADQEMDTCQIVSPITKYAARIDDVNQLAPVFHEACRQAVSGRKGPVFLDIAKSVLSSELPESISPSDSLSCPTPSVKSPSELAGRIAQAIREARHPVILAGDGINISHSQNDFRQFALQAGIPILSSRSSHNVGITSGLYFGYMGSHGIRYAHFVLSKADTVIVLGNRLSFPDNSSSFGPVFRSKRCIWIDIDSTEFLRHPSITEIHVADLSVLLKELSQYSHHSFGNHTEWLNQCYTIRQLLQAHDTSPTVLLISQLLSHIPSDSTIVSDVGNNEFMVSRACVLSNASHRVLYSKSFGTLGNALGKAIGSFYTTKQPVVVFIGDQGLQFNVQELQYISQHHLPITIFVINNRASAMIRDREEVIGYPYHLHTTENSGYRVPSLQAIAESYCIAFTDIHSFLSLGYPSATPVMVEILSPSEERLLPFLPAGHSILQMEPQLDDSLINQLEQL